MVDFAKFWYPKELSDGGGMALAAGPSFAWSAKTSQGFCIPGSPFDPTGVLHQRGAAGRLIHGKA